MPDLSPERVAKLEGAVIPSLLRRALEVAFDYVEQGATPEEATERVVAEFAQGGHRV